MQGNTTNLPFMVIQYNAMQQMQCIVKVCIEHNMVIIVKKKRVPQTLWWCLLHLFMIHHNEYFLIRTVRTIIKLYWTLRLRRWRNIEATLGTIHIYYLDEYIM